MIGESLNIYEPIKCAIKRKPRIINGFFVANSSDESYYILFH